LCLSKKTNQFTNNKVIVNYNKIQTNDLEGQGQSDLLKGLVQRVVVFQFEKNPLGNNENNNVKVSGWQWQQQPDSNSSKFFFEKVYLNFIGLENAYNFVLIIPVKFG
jgi:hypothetical protein